MKKVKIMLLSLALFAIVGAALAFKAKYGNSYCTTRTILFNGQPTCPITPGVAQACELFVNITTTVVGGEGIRFCTTSINGSGDCAGKTTCTTLNKFIDDN